MNRKLDMETCLFRKIRPNHTGFVIFAVFLSNWSRCGRVFLDSQLPGLNLSHDASGLSAVQLAAFVKLRKAKAELEKKAVALLTEEHNR